MEDAVHKGNFYNTNRFDQVKHVTVMKKFFNVKRARPTEPPDEISIFVWED